MLGGYVYGTVTAGGQTTSVRVQGLDTLDFLEGCNSEVDVEFDANSSSDAGDGQRGGPKQNYQPVIGLGGIVCRIVLLPSSSRSTHVPGRQDVTGFFRVLFPVPIYLDGRYRLGWTDLQTGMRRYLYVIGTSDNPHQMSVFWAVDAVEYAI